MNNPTTLAQKGCLTLLLAFIASCVWAQSPLVIGNDDTLPPYVVLVPDAAAMNTLVHDDAFFFARSRGVIFRVNRYVLDSRSDFLDELRDSVLPEVRRREWELLGIGLRGAASPEGPYRWNVTLSQRRAQLIIDFLQQNMGGYQNPVKAHTVAEDYVYLVLLMEQAGDPQVDVVRNIMTQCGSDIHALKVALQVVDGGRLWKRLLREYYPRLRAARLLLFFREKERPVIEPLPEIDLRDKSLPPIVDNIVVPEEPKVPKKPRRHMLAVSTNLLYDAFYLPHYGMAPMPNVELEFYPRRGKWTALVAFTCPFWQNYSTHKFFQIRDYHFEVRRYFKPGFSHTGLFLAAYANTNKYGIGWSKTEGWQGEGVGGALKAGYVWPLGKKGRWRIEVEVAAGGYVTRYDPYVYGNPISGTEDGDYYYDYKGNAKDFIRRNYRRTWIGPTDLGLKLRCDLLFWKKKL